MAKADKRIPVTEERWRQLHELKEPGQTFDELIEELVIERERAALAERARDAREADEDELTPLDELSDSSR